MDHLAFNRCDGFWKTNHNVTQSKVNFTVPIDSPYSCITYAQCAHIHTRMHTHTHTDTHTTHTDTRTSVHTATNVLLSYSEQVRGFQILWELRIIEVMLVIILYIAKSAFFGGIPC